MPFAPTACPTRKVTKNSVAFLDLAADTLPELSNKVPEKWEGLAVGPRLKDGSYALVAGTDNDYSGTQNATGRQFDVYFRFTDADPFAGSIQCPLGLTTGCFTTADIADGIINEMFDLPNDGSYKLLPGVLHAYKVPAADLGNFVRPVHHHDRDDDDDDQGDDDKE